MIYPAYLTTETDRTVLASEFNVSAQTPPTFIVQTEDDPVHVENSLVYYAALKNARFPRRCIFSLPAVMAMGCAERRSR